MAANTCTDCGTTLGADGTCPNCEENGPPEPVAKKPVPPAAKAAPAAAAAPKPPAQKWMDAFKK